MARHWAVGAAFVMAFVGAEAFAQDTVMGDWQGTRKLADGKEAPLVAQVIAWGDGSYQANLLDEFDKRIPAIVVLKGTTADGKTRLVGKAEKGELKDTEWTATIEDGKFTGSFQGAASGMFALKRVVRLSPTFNEKPPEGAIVLFPGKPDDLLSEWQQRDGSPARFKIVPVAVQDKDGKTTEEKVMEVAGGGIISRKKLMDCKVHVEFRLPFMPKAKDQGRGNSGVYLQGRYEVQVLDSYGLEGRDNECGGIYSVGAPKVNMCRPPLQWQTYDITFTAPRFDEAGKKTKNATMTVLHNGVVIQDNIEVPNPTTANWGGDPKTPGGLHLQDHGNPVQYRNIWVVETKGEQ
jgi:hypothetical protein